jgi:[acyl-carrier-protein] S-malonyltransferase
MLGYFFKAGAALVPQGADLYEEYPAMRAWCDQAGDWIGMSGPELLSLEFKTGDPLCLSMLRSIVVSLGIVDILADMGVKPRAVAGYCGGIMPAACMAGCIERKDLVTLVGRLADVRMETDDRPQAVAYLGFAGDTPDSEVEWFYGEEWPDVFLAADSGLIADGTYRVITVSGYVDDLERLAAHMPKKEHMKLNDTYGAVHSPQYQPVRDFMEPHIRAIDFRAPALPLISGFQPEALTTADELADAFIRSYTDPVWLNHIRFGLRKAGVRVTFGVGPGTPQMSFLQWPFEVTEVLTPDDIQRVTSTTHEFAAG